MTTEIRPGDRVEVRRFVHTPETIYQEVWFEGVAQAPVTPDGSLLVAVFFEETWTYHQRENWRRKA